MKLSRRTTSAGMLSVAAVAAAVAVAGCGSSGAPSSALRSESMKTFRQAVEAKTAPTTASAVEADAAVASTEGNVQRVDLEIRTTEKLKGEEQPRYVPVGATAASLKSWTGNIVVKKGETVILTIVNTDNGKVPLEPGYRRFDEVQGGTETVDGRPITSAPNSDIAHTFTDMGLGINAPIPSAPENGTDTIVLTFKPTQTGKFPWQCYDPCGSGSEGWGAAMDTHGWMQGTITVIS